MKVEQRRKIGRNYQISTNRIYPLMSCQLLIMTTDALEKTLMLGNIEGKRRRGHRGCDGWMALLTQRTDLNKLWERVEDREAWCASVQSSVLQRVRQ